MKGPRETGDDTEDTRAEVDYWLDGRVVCRTAGGELLRRGAMQVVLERTWQDCEEKLYELDAIIVADANYPCVLSCHVKNRLNVIVLCGELCERPREQQVYYVAHELAHFLLGHSPFGQLDSGQAELEADELVESWGFKCPNGLPPHPALRPHGAPG